MLPRVIIHNAMSLDGRITGLNADIELYYNLVGTWHEDATLVGAGTILAAPDEIPPEDEGALAARRADPDDKRPLLVVPDSRGRIRHWHYLLAQPYWRNCVVLCSRATSGEYLDYLQKRHIEYLVTGDDHADMPQALELLNSHYGVRVVRLDSGGTLNSIMLRARLVNEISLLVHPQLVGGLSTKSFYEGTGMNSPVLLKLLHVEEQRNGLVWLRYEVL